MIDSFLKYLQYEERCSPHTLTAYETDLRQFLDFLQQTGEFKEPEHASFHFIRSWIINQVESGKGPASVNRKIATLRAYYKFLLKRGIITDNPMLKIKALKTPKRLPVFIEEKNLTQLLDTFDFTDNFAGIRDQLVLEMLYGTGMRLAEILGLKEIDVSLAEKTAKVTGKRNKHRIIPLNTSLLHLLEKYLAYKKSYFGPTTEPLIVLTDDGKPAYPMMIYRLVKKYLGLATTHEKRSPHVLRHTFATHLLNKGADLNAIKDLLGHSSLAATQVYTHHSISKLKEIYEQAHPKA